MKTNQLTLDTLHLLSPDLAQDFREQLEAAVMDCRQRPSLAKKREINIRLTITPNPNDPDDVDINPVTTRKTPARELATIRARRTPKNQLQFDYDPDQFD